MQNKKEILLMAHNMNLGGTEKALLSFINALENKNISLTVLLLEKKGALLKDIPNWVTLDYVRGFDNIEPIIYDPPINLIKTNLNQLKLIQVFKHTLRYIKVKLTGNWHLNYIEALKRIEQHHKADIAIAFAGPSDFITYYIYKKVKASQKIQWIHFDVSKIIFNKNFGNTYYPYFDKIFCVSENAKKVFDTMFPQFAFKTYVFKNIVSKTELETLALKGETFYDDFKGLKILTLGRLSEEKGQQMIPDIVQRLKNEGLIFKWYLIGDGKLSEGIKQQIELLNIKNELVLLGSKLNPYRFVKDCDIYVQTSFHEGYCLTVHEAKIFNKPVVVTNVASASNLIVNNEDGLIVEISKEGIYNGVKSLLTNTNLRVCFEKNCLAAETTNEINKLEL